MQRWDRQQERYAIGREERLSVVVDVVKAGTAGVAHPLVVDLGCGPGSLAVQVARRLPGAEVVGVDVDPLLLALGRIAHPGSVRFVETVIGHAGWTGALALNRRLDAVVASTALHYLPETSLTSLYLELADLLGPGGLLVNADHIPVEEAEIARLASSAGIRRFPEPIGEHWAEWWTAAAADPALAHLYAQRSRRDLPSGDWSLSESRHIRLLRQAGFIEVGTVWRRGPSAVLVAVR